MPDLEKLREAARQEAEMCLYCGFCEAVCPTLSHGPHRGYGPRGRLAVAARLLAGGRASGEALASIYSCLLCRACTLRCPVSIDVADIMRVVRVLYSSGGLEGERQVEIRVRG
ncbi:(Fe-S)-binding protein [Pyrodictium occultum]|nr:(Fe-S)-binding protein [Pyrodictium occultum]